MSNIRVPDLNIQESVSGSMVAVRRVVISCNYSDYYYFALRKVWQIIIAICSDDAIVMDIIGIERIGTCILRSIDIGEIFVKCGLCVDCCDLCFMLSG